MSPGARPHPACQRAAALVLLAAMVPATAAAEASRPPNIVLILADDLGYGDTSVTGSARIETPNIDRLAQQGQRWTSFYAAGCVCVPSRGGLMSGRDPARIWGETRIRSALPSKVVTLAEMLRARGYATALFGKWHLGMQTGEHPLDQGFDVFYGTPSSNDHFRMGPKRAPGDYRAIQDLVFDVPLMRQRKTIEQPADQALFTQRYTEASVDWIRRNKQRPFFLYLAHNMPHVPLAASKPFQNRSRGGLYGDVVEEIDWSVGKIVETIEEQGLERDTVILFTSDNGPWLTFHELAGSPAPFRDGKGTSWEGAYRVPTIFRWPGRIEPGVVDALGTGVDLWRTFASIASAEVDAPGELDSLDLGPVLFGQAPGPRRSWFYLHESGRILAVRSGRYKLHLRPPQPARGTIASELLLFDLERDPGESRDVAAEHPEVVQRLKRLLSEYRATLPAAAP